MNQLTAADTVKAMEGFERAIHSDDELFHFYLYEWNVSRGHQDTLLNVSVASDYANVD
jgi:hypothetical protein